jgi:hypothetical protein
MDFGHADIVQRDAGTDEAANATLASSTPTSANFRRWRRRRVWWLIGWSMAKRFLFAWKPFCMGRAIWR